MTIEAIPLPILQDNYIWLLRQGQYAIVVDPGLSEPVQHYLQHEQLTLTAILITHQHPDHIGGLQTLRECWPRAEVYVPAASAQGVLLAGIQLQDGQQILPAHWQEPITVLTLPGHTLNHLGYLQLRNDADALLFCGDTLFSAGCGRLFEGSPAQMLSSLQKLAALPAKTLVCCSHEYTMANLKFAQTVEPDNQMLVEHRERVARLRDAGQPSLPSTIALERQINPFLRCEEPALQQRWQQQNALDLFTFLRQWKNSFQ